MTAWMHQGCSCLAAFALLGCAETRAPVAQAHFPVRPWHGRDRSESFRLGPPAAGPEVKLPPQAVEETELPNGMRILLVPRHDFPLVNVALVLRRGAVDAPPGVADMASRLLAAMQRVWMVRANPEAVWLFISMPPGLIPLRFHIGADLLRRPVFTDYGLAVEQTRMRTERATDSPSVRVVDRLLYPEGHAYRVPGRGLGVLADKINLGQLTDFARMNIAPDQTVVVAVGDITMSRLKELAEDAFENWVGKAALRTPPPPAVDRLPVAPTITLIDRPTLTQSEILVAAPGSSVLAKDFAALEVLNAILCGAPTTSRINSVMREERGYTYQAISLLDARLGPGPFLLKQAVAKESTTDSLREVLHQIDRLRREDVSEEELGAAQARLQSSVLLAYDSFQTTFDSLVRMAILGLPADHATHQLARIRTVTVKDVRAAAAKYLATERLRVVVVGDVTAIKKPLEAIGLGEVHVVENQ